MDLSNLSSCTLSLARPASDCFMDSMMRALHFLVCCAPDLGFLYLTMYRH